MPRKSRRNRPQAATQISMGDIASLQSAFPDIFGGRNINPDTAQTFSAVYRAVRLIAGTISMLPLKVFKDVNGTPVEQPSHPVARMLDMNLNPECTNVVFMDRLIQDVLLAGDAIAIPVGTFPLYSGMIYVPRTNVQIYRRSAGSEILYTCTLDNGKQITLPQDMVLHVAGYGFDGLHGKSIIKYASRSINTSLNADTYSEEFFDNSSAPLGYLSFDKPLKKETADFLLQYWERQYKGHSNSHRTAIVPDGGKWNTVNVDPADAQLIESRRYQVSDIARFFGVPLHLLQESNGSGGWVNGLEQQNLAFLIYTLMPLMERITQAIDRAILDKGLWCQFDMSLLQRGDTKSRYEAYQIALGGNRMPGWMTINDVRTLENLAPVPDGDKVYQPVEDTQTKTGGDNADTKPSPIDSNQSAES